MAKEFVVNSDYLKKLLKSVEELKANLGKQSFIDELTQWGTVPFGASDWTATGTSTSSSATTAAGYTLLPGWTAFVPAAHLQSAATAYASSAQTAVNWLNSVLDDLSRNISDMIRQIASMESDNGLTAADVTRGFGPSISAVGG